MTLQKLRDWLSLLQVAIAALSVLAGGGMPWTSLALASVLIAWAFLRPLPPKLSLTKQRLWTFGIFIALVVTGTRAILLAEFLDAGVDFLLLLVVQRMFNRQRAREHLQLLLLGTLLMVVGAVINTGLLYPVMFAAYLVAAVMALLLNHLMAEGERLGPRVRQQLGAAAMRGRADLWKAGFGVAAFAGVGAILVFVLFPRFGVGVFLRGAMATESRSGFAGQVQLGEFGRIKSDATVAARMRPVSPLPVQQRLTWHLRGSSFDSYDKGLWSHGKRARRTQLAGTAGFSSFMSHGLRSLIRNPGFGRYDYVPRPIEGFAASSEYVHMQVTLEDMGVDALFIASSPIAVRLNPRGSLERRRIKVRSGLNAEVKVDKPPGPVQYEFVARLGVPTHSELALVGSPPPQKVLRAYLQRSQGLSAQVNQLAQDLTANTRTRIAKVDAVMAHLAGFSYTTDLRTSARVEAGADPLEGFLFDTQEGHCEYYATALAVLLREVGVPTRIVNGYYGAHYNPLGDFYAIRQSDAHSWVEVHFGERLGWVAFDPTPPSGRTAGDDAAFWPAFSIAVDALRNTYLQYVIDYNLSTQLEMLENLGVSNRGAGGVYRVAWAQVLTWLGGLAAVVFAAWLLRRRLRRPTQAEVSKIYAGLVAAFARRGTPRHNHESASAFARRLGTTQQAGATELQAFAGVYEAYRFGNAPSPQQLSRLRELARQVRAALRM